MEKILSKEEREKTDALLRKHQPKEGEKKEETIVISEKGKKITVKTEAASTSIKPFKKRPVEYTEEASKRKYEVVGMDIAMEYEEMNTEEEESKVKKLTEEELEMFHQYKEFYTIQGRPKGKIPGFRYIHRLKVKEHYPGVPSDVAEMLSHPIKGEIQDLDRIMEQEVIEIE